MALIDTNKQGRPLPHDNSAYASPYHDALLGSLCDPLETVQLDSKIASNCRHVLRKQQQKQKRNDLGPFGQRIRPQEAQEPQIVSVEQRRCLFLSDIWLCCWRRKHTCFANSPEHQPRRAKRGLRRARARKMMQNALVGAHFFVRHVYFCRKLRFVACRQK